MLFILGIFFSLGLAYLPLFLFGGPTLFFPFPLYMIFFSVVRVEWLASLSIYLLICLFFYRENHFRKRAIFLNVFLFFSTLIWFISARDLAFDYQGFSYFLVCLIQNLIFQLGLWWCSLKSKRITFYIFILYLYLTFYYLPFFGEPFFKV